MVLTSIDALGNGSSLAHLLQGLFRARPYYAPGARSGLKVLLVFLALALLFMAVASVGVAISEDTGMGTFSRHASAWYWAISFLALLSIIVIQYSLMTALGALAVSSDTATVNHGAGLTSSVLPRPPTSR
jgi:hypothetical protein